MIVALALAVASLAEAQAAFSEGAYDKAEKLALEAAHPPQAGAALYLAGLARFRLGKPAEALDALDEAGKADDKPAEGLWRYNRAACLYDLGRFADAEAEFAKAAGLDSSIASAAWLNAGFAALDAGAPDRAKDFAARARQAGAGELTHELEARIAGFDVERANDAYREGLTAFDAGRFADARNDFLRAAQLDPSDGRPRIMSGASALRLGELGDARKDLEQALTMGLDEANARAAHDYLDSMTRGMAARAHGWEGTLRLAGGFDDNALQTSGLQFNEFPGEGNAQTPSGLATADAALSYRLRLRPDFAMELAYTFDQLAYFNTDAADRSLQQHGLALSGELSLRPQLRLGGSIAGQMAWTGLGKFRSLQNVFGAGAWLAWDETDNATARFDLDWSRRLAPSEFSYLQGFRADAIASQEIRFAPWTLDFGAQLRLEDIGSATTVSPVPCPAPGGCMVSITEPFNYAGTSAFVAGRSTLWSKLDVEVSLGAEWRHYLDDNVAQLAFPDGHMAPTNLQRRDDLRVATSAGASWRLTPRLALQLRYDLIVSESSISGDRRRQVDNDDHNFEKQVFTLGTALSW